MHLTALKIRDWNIGNFFDIIRELLSVKAFK